jgi:hypothetical protein
MPRLQQNLDDSWRIRHHRCWSGSADRNRRTSGSLIDLRRE